VVLAPKLKEAILKAYVAIGGANAMTLAAAMKQAGGVQHSTVSVDGSDPAEAAKACKKDLQQAQKQLLKFLRH
jgi:hypothetical protein